MLKNKILIGVFAFILLLIVGVLATEWYLDKKLDKALRTDLERQLGKEYDIEFDKASVSLFKNEVRINNLSFTRKDKLEKDWVFTAGDVNFVGFHGFAFLMGKGLGVDSIILLDPNIDMNRFIFSKNQADSTNTHSKKKTENPKLDSLKISIGAIKCSRGNVNYNPDGPEKLTASFDFLIKDLDFEGKLKNIETLWDDSGLILSNVTYQFPDSVYKITVDQIDLSLEERDIELTRFSYYSNLSEVAFPRHFGWRKSKLKIDIPKLSISRPKDFSDSLLVISKMQIDSLYFEIHKNLSYPWPDRVTKLPQEFFANMDIPIRVDSIAFKNSAFKFIGVFDGRPSELEFSDIRGSLTGFQNIDTSGKLLTFNANAIFMKETEVDFQTIYSYGKYSPFSLNAKIGATKLSFMSDFLQSVAGIRIASGEASKLEIAMSGNEFGQQGHVDFYYTNLKVDAVDKDSGEKKWLLNVVADLARGVLFWKANPNTEKFRRGEFSGKRTLYKAFASQWIDGLFDGIIQSVSKIDPDKVRLKKDKKR